MCEAEKGAKPGHGCRSISRNDANFVQLRGIKLPRIKANFTGCSGQNGFRTRKCNISKFYF